MKARTREHFFQEVDHRTRLFGVSGAQSSHRNPRERCHRHMNADFKIGSADKLWEVRQRSFQKRALAKILGLFDELSAVIRKKFHRDVSSLAWQSLGFDGHLFAMVASVYRVKPHEVFDRHRTETGTHDVLATGDPSTTFLVEPGECPFQADARLSRRGRSASRVHRLVGLEPLRKCVLLQDPVEE